MKTSMTLFGCGPKLALLCLPYIILSLAVIFYYPGFSDLDFLNNSAARSLGFIWMGLGIIYWVYSAIYFIKYFKPGVLLIKGPFGLCRNPIYSSIIIFIVPSLGIIFHSGLIISIAVMLYIGFKLTIHGEAIVLKRIFGREYDDYEASVNEIIPFPRPGFSGKS